MIAFYHQINIPISFWYRRGLKSRYLNQSSETLLVELIGIHRRILDLNTLHLHFCVAYTYLLPFYLIFRGKNEYKIKNIVIYVILCSKGKKKKMICTFKNLKIIYELIQLMVLIPFVFPPPPKKKRTINLIVCITYSYSKWVVTYNKIVSEIIICNS